MLISVTSVNHMINLSLDSRKVPISITLQIFTIYQVFSQKI